MYEDDIDETTLIEKAKQGDESSFAVLYNRYWNRVHLLLLRELGDRELAEELTQEAFIKAFKYIKSYNGELSTFCTWVGTIALNKPRTRPSNPLPEDFNDLDEITPERILEGKEELGVLQKLMEKLPKKRRQALYLWAVEGLTYESISAIMGTSVPTVKMYVYRARLDLRRMYDK